MLRPAILAASIAVAALPAAAQTRPTVHPTRDVAVEYHVTGAESGTAGPHQVGTIKIQYDAQGHRMRIEPEGHPGYMIVNRAAAQMFMVVPEQHMYMELPYNPQPAMNYDSQDASFTRRGSDTVAGLPCTVYDVKGSQHTGEVCLTDDGVMLRATDAGPQHRGGLEATHVSYGTLPASLFAPPPGFQKMDSPHMGPPGRPSR